MEAAARRVGTLFYLVHPNASTFQHAEEVPDYANEAVPVVIIIVILEMAVKLAMGRPYRVNEALSSASHGAIHEVGRMLVTGTMLLGYEWLYQYRLLDLAWDSLFTWLAAFVLVDFCYYWVHRANHELNILWAFHQVHHSNEDFNFATGLRISMFQKLSHFGFYQPLALVGIPLPAVLVHTSLNFVAQFWVHSSMGSLGPLEGVIATPSFHRVHHGANNWCLDKNYTSVLVLWDHLFGTYEPEREDTEIVFGLTQQPQTFNALYHEFFYFGEVFRKARSMSTWTDSLKAVFYGPGWTPGSPRLGDPAKFPVITAPRTKYDPQIPRWQLLYIAVHLLVIALLQQQLFTRYPTASWVTVMVFLVFITCSVGVVTAMMDGWRWAGPAEGVRCTVFLLYARSLFATHVPVLDAALTLFFSLCAFFWTSHSLAHRYAAAKTQKIQ
ncbi:alkylglycerol monooxygenase-like [Eriocheir sinensis]|uniref:alkylglycerol monooxygenase-like n=1 Tax=Eriocheir sinensis TaxID=95602 RepID=UPI0021C996D7|nr:alkylglycerol monooxygenase-like [Eriocheir sinensis]